VKHLLLLLALASCAPKSAEQVADRFVDLYFVEIDQRRALELTSGLARQELNEELSLTANVRQNYESSDVGQPKPSIYYKRRDAQIAGDHGRLSYDLTIRHEKDETLKNALISVEHSDGKWTVANFILQEGALPSRPKAP
jgi:hypothetical protein